MLSHFGVILGHPEVILGHPEVILGYPGVILESSWSHPGVILESSWSHPEERLELDHDCQSGPELDNCGSYKNKHESCAHTTL